MKIVHVITSLDDGGAEAVLYRLCLADRENAHVIVTLRGAGKYGPLLEREGFQVHALGMERGRVTIPALWKLARVLRQVRPDVVQTWMYHGDLVGGSVARMLGIRRVVWGSHHTSLDPNSTRRGTLIVAKINALLSHWVPRRIVSCSAKGVAVHSELGYARKRFTVVPNGHDLRQFAPRPDAGQELRVALGVPPDLPLIGMVARFDPLKDHHNLLRALSILKDDGVPYRCLLIGTGMDSANGQLSGWLDSLNVRDRILLLGQRSDIPVVMNALDVHVLSSECEALPNVLCEAMACGTPCVTTDVGDAPVIVGGCGWVVPAKSPEALAEAIRQAVAAMRSSPGAWADRKAAARQRIMDSFTVEKMVQNYNRVWVESAHS